MRALFASIVAVCFFQANTWAQNTPSQENQPGPIRLMLPETVYAAPGIETNIYFDNLILVINPRNYAFDVTCDKGKQQSERWTFTPASEEAGAFPLKIEVRNSENQIVASAQTSIQVSPQDAGKDKPVSLLMIGDSLTHASIYPQRVVEACSTPGNPALTLVGAHVPENAAPGVRHEGYGGWAASTFATKYTGIMHTGTYSERGSPFLYDDGKGNRSLDFARYCQDINGGKTPDYITIFLGCNDTFGATDETIESTIDGMLSHMDALVAMIHRVNPNTGIGFMPPVPPAASQDAFGANYTCGQTQWQYRRNQHRAIERMYQHFGARQQEHISMIPAFVNLDCVHNYPEASEPTNAQKEDALLRQNNGVHPAPQGYRQIGDSLYCWLKAQVITTP